ncbi:hypothetical protein JW906_14520 [bacterium]|nr:hypothetical protein [bacterium]
MNHHPSRARMHRIAAVFFCFIVMLLSCSKTDIEPASNTLWNADLQAMAEQQAECAVWSVDPASGVKALHLKPQPGLELHLPGPDEIPWNQAKYLVADVRHENRHSAILYFHFFRKNEGAAPRISSKIGVLPELRTRIILPLEYLDGQTFFMQRFARQLKGTMPGRRLPLDSLSAVTVGLEPNEAGFKTDLWISSLRLTLEKPSPLPDEKPVVDAFGQWKARDWPGKISNEKELVEKIQGLHQQVKDASFPDSWSQYGGWKLKRFESTGFFRTEHDGRRWWLVDPDGCAFFSAGVDVCRPSAEGPVQGMEDLLEWLPEEKGGFASAFEGRRGGFSYLTANLIRAFSDDWENKWLEMTSGLLRQNGFNTVGNWSDRGFAGSAALPWVLPLRGFPSTQVKLYRDFPDVFSPEYRTASLEFSGQMEELKDDPYLIGYFLANEPLWAFGDNIIASEMLATTQPSASRKELAGWLRKKYRDDIEAFSKSWKRGFDSFESLETLAVLDAASLSANAEADLREFSAVLVDEYLKHPVEALRKVDRNHLNLGIRYAWISSELCYRGGKYFDVFSINSYSEKPDEKVIAEIVRRTGRPVMIGEFHFGALDMGLPATGIRGVPDQADRGAAYRYYVEQGAVLPGLVGIHYFQLNDQPVLGRFDGENYNIGLVDICNMPYTDLTGAMKRTHDRLYGLASGVLKPFDQQPERIPAIFY